MENVEIVVTTLNGIPRSWDSFIQGICARKKLVKLSRLWEECSQEEARIAAQEENMGNEYQDLTVHSEKTRRNRHHSKGNISHPKRDLSTIRCYTCDEKGHISRFFPNKGNLNKKKENKRRHHAHAAEDDEPSTKRTGYESEYSSSDEDYVLISALMGNITHGSNDWLIDSGASKHMIGRN